MWCMDSYGKFMELAMKLKETGAYLRQSVFYFKDMVEDLPAQLDKMNELCHLPGFRHDENSSRKLVRVCMAPYLTCAHFVNIFV